VYPTLSRAHPSGVYHSLAYPSRENTLVEPTLVEPTPVGITLHETALVDPNLVKPTLREQLTKVLSTAMPFTFPVHIMPSWKLTETSILPCNSSELLNIVKFL
jgi:hypothetical protein